MTQMTGLQDLEAAARSVAAKLEAFHESLTPDEQRALGLALRHACLGGEDTTEDAAGYFIPGPLLPLIVVKIRELVEQQSSSTTRPAPQPAQTPRRQ